MYTTKVFQVYIKVALQDIFSVIFTLVFLCVDGVYRFVHSKKGSSSFKTHPLKTSDIQSGVIEIYACIQKVKQFTLQTSGWLNKWLDIQMDKKNQISRWVFLVVLNPHTWMKTRRAK